MIDIHAHACYWDLFPKAALLGLLGADRGAAGGPIFLLEDKEGERILKAFLSDHDGSKQIRQMDQAGVNFSVLVAMDFGDGYGRAVLDPEGVLKHHQDLMARHPGRFTAFYGVNPLSQSSFEWFRRSVEEFGFKGMKLHPPLGFSPDDAFLEPFYHFCDSRRLPVMIHTGPSMPGLDWYGSKAPAIDRVSRAHPGINFILAHAGWRLEPEFVRMALDLENVFLDMAGFHSAPIPSGSERSKRLGGIFQPLLRDKILFGSDWPLFNIMQPLARTVDMLKELFADSVHAGSPEVLTQILSGNARRALNLEPATIVRS